MKISNEISNEQFAKIVASNGHRLRAEQNTVPFCGKDGFELLPKYEPDSLSGVQLYLFNGNIYEVMFTFTYGEKSLAYDPSNGYRQGFATPISVTKINIEI